MKITQKLLLGLSLCLLTFQAAAQSEVRLAVHGAFSLPDEQIKKFEQENNAKLTIIKVGSGNEMLNKLILSRAKPIADVVYGLDNVNIIKAWENGILSSKQPTSVPTDASLPGVLAIDYAYVVLNYDKKWFEDKKLPLPQSLEDLAKPAYKDLLVLSNPGTSSPGLAFLMANIGGLGEEQAFKWWADMRKNGVKVTQSWSDAYYTDFTQNGGSRPLIVSYATSPAAEVYFSKGKYTVPPTGNLFLKGGVFRQIEGAAVLKGAENPGLAMKLAAYLQSAEVQKTLPSEMWVYPAAKGTPLPQVFEFAQTPKQHYTPSSNIMIEKQKQWVSRWIRTVLK
ncbi:thiamine ABC transporter substrate-binding protein [Neisseria sp. CSL10203-ORH2]|uniref:Thiamine ABC transporter substrate-binding protein n=1 Tax=Neisseria montereyensis TaxID=2973938 RepID=A0ABT2FDB2_9NEIS|nr:thiamine ABC transporter substrate-binding protein [Neisseria montereyensis]MCS4533945.1 thiamine ABC transporter substrate-binding protein [Neisseria montereyensis]